MHTIDRIVLRGPVELSWMAHQIAAEALLATPPSGIRAPLADAVATCPPHHRDVAPDRTETCRKCGDVRYPKALRDSALSATDHERALRGALRGGAASAAKRKAR